MWFRSKRPPTRYSYTLLIAGDRRRLTETAVRNEREAITEAGLMIDAVIKSERPRIVAVAVSQTDVGSTRPVGEWAWAAGDPKPTWARDAARRLR